MIVPLCNKQPNLSLFFISSELRLRTCFRSRKAMCYYVSAVFMLMLLIELFSCMSSEVTAEEKLGDILWVVDRIFHLSPISKQLLMLKSWKTRFLKEKKDTLICFLLCRGCSSGTWTRQSLFFIPCLLGPTRTDMGGWVPGGFFFFFALE